MPLLNIELKRVASREVIEYLSLNTDYHYPVVYTLFYIVVIFRASTNEEKGRIFYSSRVTPKGIEDRSPKRASRAC